MSTDFLAPLREMFLPERRSNNATAATTSPSSPTPPAASSNNRSSSSQSKSASSSSSSFGSKLIVFGTVAAAAVLTVKVYRCCYRTFDSTREFGVVYDIRRGSVFSSSPIAHPAPPSTSTGNNKKSSSANAKRETLARPPKSVVQRILREIFPPIGDNVLLVPPSGLHRFFTFPRSVLDSSRGATIKLVIQDVQFADRQKLSAIEFHVSYYLDIQDIPRFLCLVGSTLPNKIIGDLCGACLREDALHTNFANVKQYLAVLHKQNKKSSFFQALFDKMASRLVSEACVVVKEIAVSNAELSD